MNEKLRKAILEATGMWAWTDKEKGMIVVKESDCLESEAKLMRVIEVLVVQRNKFADCCDRLIPFDEAIQPFDAELIAALEEKMTREELLTLRSQIKQILKLDRPVRLTLKEHQMKNEEWHYFDDKTQFIPAESYDELLQRLHDAEDLLRAIDEWYLNDGWQGKGGLPSCVRFYLETYK